MMEPLERRKLPHSGEVNAHCDFLSLLERPHCHVTRFLNQSFLTFVEMWHEKTCHVHLTEDKNSKNTTEINIPKSELDAQR
jgi:hypothetical protein